MLMFPNIVAFLFFPNCQKQDCDLSSPLMYHGGTESMKGGFQSKLILANAGGISHLFLT